MGKMTFQSKVLSILCCWAAVLIVTTIVSRAEQTIPLELPLRFKYQESKAFGSARSVNLDLSISNDGKFNAVLYMHNGQEISGYSCKVSYAFCDKNGVMIARLTTPINGVKAAFFRSAGANTQREFAYDLPMQLVSQSKTVEIKIFAITKSSKDGRCDTLLEIFDDKLRNLGSAGPLKFDGSKRVND